MSTLCSLYPLLSIFLCRSLFLLAMEARLCKNVSTVIVVFSQAMLLRLCPWNIKAKSERITVADTQRDG